MATPLTSDDETLGEKERLRQEEMLREEAPLGDKEASAEQDAAPRAEDEPLSGNAPDPNGGDAAPLKDRLDFLSETLLDLPTMLDELVKQGFISQRQAEDILIAPRTKKELSQHPLEIVADRGYENRKQPGRELDLETMTLWLAERSGQPYERIDPLQVNVNAVTEVMSYAFAQRHNILAIEVSDDEVVIASAQPFMFQWETMLTQTLRGRRIRRVVTSPRTSPNTSSSSTPWPAPFPGPRKRASRYPAWPTSSRCSSWAS